MGDEVIVTVRDKYCGMRGKLIGCRGKMFWNIKLAKEEDREDQVIFKMESSVNVA